MIKKVVIIRGGGDLATGVAVRLARSGIRVIVTELAKPMSVRRMVSCSEAVYTGRLEIEDTLALRVDTFNEALETSGPKLIPVLVDPEMQKIQFDVVDAVIDARLLKRDVKYELGEKPLIVGLGPNFEAKQNCHFAIETERGHDLGKVIRQGSSRTDTGLPDGDPRRVLRAPCDGTIRLIKDIGEHVEAGDPVAAIGDTHVRAIIGGMIRGLIHDGTELFAGVKIGDIDPRNKRTYCFTISDKAYAIGGGVLEGLMEAWNR